MPRSTSLAALTILLLTCAGGCMRSAPLATDDIDCRPGRGVVVDGSALCVYRPPELPEMCPEALPNRFEVEGTVICALEVRPSGAVLEIAVDVTGREDGGLSIIDAGADGARPFIVDAGGALRADF